MKHGNKNLVLIAILISLASGIYYFESFLPMPFAVPGAKWGFSNFPLLMGLMLKLNLGELILISISKSILGSILGGRFLSPSFFMGFFGNIVAVLSMYFAKQTSFFGILGISEIGAFFNNLTQVTVAWLLIIKSKGIFFYLPYMLLFGSIAAFANALLTKYSLKVYYIQNFNSEV